MSGDAARLPGRRPEVVVDLSVSDVHVSVAGFWQRDPERSCTRWLSSSASSFWRRDMQALQRSGEFDLHWELRCDPEGHLEGTGPGTASHSGRTAES